MIDLSLRSNTKKEENIEVVYNLIFRNALYSMECYKVGYEKKNINNYCLVEDFTEDEGEAEVFIHRMAKGKVLPVHINDMVEDFFTE
jgi:hypothetical protein